MTCEDLRKKPWLLTVRALRVHLAHELLSQSPGATEKLFLIKNNEITKRHKSRSRWYNSVRASPQGEAQGQSQGDVPTEVYVTSASWDVHRPAGAATCSSPSAHALAQDGFLIRFMGNYYKQLCRFLVGS